MIIYGTGVAHLISEPSENATCPNCQSTGTLTFNIYSNHVYLYWIPLFPTIRKGNVECSHCELSMEKKNMPFELKKEYKEINSMVKPPFWQYAGVAAVVIGLAISGVFGIYNKHQRAQLLETPIEGDVYRITTDYGYSTMRVVATYNDSIYVTYNDYEIDMKSEVKDIDIPSNYTDSLMYAFSTGQIKEMYTNGEIYDIKRHL